MTLALGPWIPRLRRAVIALAVLIVLFGVVGYFAIPKAVRWGLETVASRELGRAVRVESVSANPYTLRATMRGVVIEGAPGENAPLLSVRQIIVNASSLSLCHRAPVLDALSIDEKQLGRLHRLNFPLTLLHQTPPESLNIPVITIENKDGALMLVDHLVEVHGRRRIVYLQGPEGHEDSVWRERGYRESLEAHGIPFDPELVGMGGFDDEEAFATIQEMILDGIEFDAVFAGEDDAAMGVYRALKLANRTTPNDVSVVGFDDIPFARHMFPALTTIHAPIEEVGREAVRQLKCLMDGRQAQALTLMRTELVIRESCGCTPGSKISNHSSQGGETAE